MKQSRGFDIKSLMNEMRKDNDDGWFIVFENIKLDEERLEEFYDNKNDLSEYFSDIGSMVIDEEGRKDND